MYITEGTRGFLDAGIQSFGENDRVSQFTSAFPEGHLRGDERLHALKPANRELS